jgi:hypothetical protein
VTLIGPHVGAVLVVLLRRAVVVVGTVVDVVALVVVGAAVVVVGPAVHTQKRFPVSFDVDANPQ